MAQDDSISTVASDDVLAVALAGGKTFAEAAALAGISVRTAYRRMEDPEFAEYVRDIRLAVVKQAAALMANSMADAATTLRGLLKSDVDTVKLAAARTIITTASELVQMHDLIEKMSDLRRRCGEPYEEGDDDEAY